MNNRYTPVKSNFFSSTRVERFVLNPFTTIPDYEKIFADLWDAIKDVVEDNPDIINRMFGIYESRFSHCLPRKLVNLQWIREADYVELMTYDYKDALSLRECASCEVERLEAEDWLKERYDSLKKAILSYTQMDDEELESFIEAML